MSQMKRERPQQTQRRAGGFRCARTDLPEAPLAQLSTSQGQWSKAGQASVRARSRQCLGRGTLEDYVLPPPLYFRGDFPLHVCLQSAQMPYDNGQPRAALQAAAEPGVLLLQVLFPPPLSARAGAHPNPFFPQLSLQWGVFSREWLTWDI